MRDLTNEYFDEECGPDMVTTALRLAEAVIDVVSVAMDRGEQRRTMSPAARAAWNGALGRARDQIRADLTDAAAP